MTLRLYNSAHRTKEEFIPLKEGRVGMYVCGVTVYDLCHIGHARSAIVFDVLVKYLRARAFDVTYVRNFTDIDDKIIARAQELGRAPHDLAREYIDAFYEDMERLGVAKADIEPKATEHVGDMIEMIQVLVDKGFAYEVDGDVFYSIERLNSYGTLSGRRVEDMKAGSRIAVDDRKRHPMDFVLWKSAKPGEPQWESPWGPGRPGWHMECSVMSNHFLGETFDIHGGGKDLLFPHHENERAQSVAAHGGQFARYWVHNGFVTVESEKMSKSLGNFLTIREALGQYHPEVLRLFLLSKHYRSPLDFSKAAVLDLQSGLIRIYRTLHRLEGFIGSDSGDLSIPGLLDSHEMDASLAPFIQSMDDDLNTAEAIGFVFERVKDMNRLMDSIEQGQEKDARGQLEQDRIFLMTVGRILGLFTLEPRVFLNQMSKSSDAVDSKEVEALIQERTEARTQKDWARADAIRDRLKEMGVLLEDGPQGTTWRFDV